MGNETIRVNKTITRLLLQKVEDLRLPSPSLSATLDVRRWPVGTYLLLIHTPQGVATKKLTIVR